jgi:hypothetical protein
MDLLLEGTLEDQRLADKEKYESYVDRVLEDPDDVHESWIKLEDSPYD